MAVFVFDIDDTLYRRGDAYLCAYHKVIGAIPGVDDDTVIRVSRHWSDLEFDRYGRGEISMEEMNILRVQHTYHEFGIEVSEERAKRFQDAYKQAQSDMQLLPEMRETLLYLKKKKIVTGVLSNGESAHQRFKYHSLHLEELIPEENVLVSGDIGITKPDPEIFRVFEERTGAPRDEYWFVGDSPENDMDGAAAAGWHFIWIRWEDQYPENHNRRTGIKADHILRGTDGILEIVREIVG